MSSQRYVFSRSSWDEARRVAGYLRNETIGGAVLLAAAVLGWVWANSPWREAYHQLVGYHLGFWRFDLSLAHWAADGLLAVFFFVVGMELKHEFTHGELHDPVKAAIPVIAACCGVAVPAIMFASIQFAAGNELRGWAIPTATDIAFGLAVLAAIDSHLPGRLRSFLLTLAVVDDLIAILIIACFYGSQFSIGYLGLALVPLALFAFAVRRRPRWWPLLIPLAAATWGCVYLSGIHATIAGVALGLVVPVGVGDSRNLVTPIEHRVRPISAGFCVPVFAFCSVGVTVIGTHIGAAFSDSITLGIVVSLVLGKLIGVMGGTWVSARIMRAQLDHDIVWRDVLGLSLLAGIGFTVSLLIGALAYGEGSEADDHVKLGVLTGSLLAAGLATLVLVRRNAAYRRIEEEENRDDDGDGIPDVYQTRPTPGDAAEGTVA